MHTNTYIFRHFYYQYLVLFTTVPRNTARARKTKKKEKIRTQGSAIDKKHTSTWYGTFSQPAFFIVFVEERPRLRVGLILLLDDKRFEQRGG